jgi:hypothetical protein
MRPTRLTGLLLLFCLVCFVYAWMMNAGEAAAAGLGILMVLAIRADIFHLHMQTLVSSLTVTRSADKTILHQNSIVNITTSVTTVVKQITASFEDILPAGAVLVSGSTQFTNGETSYSFNLPVIGGSYFRGVQVTCCDLFFTRTLLIARNAEEPKLTMYPTGIAQTHHDAGLGAAWSAQESDRPALLQGFDTRMLRPYAQGDSIRDVDWKLTGKHQKLYVRLKMDASGGLPAVIADIPPAGASPELCIHFAETVLGALESINIGEEYPVLFISGAMYLGMVRSGSAEEIFAMLRRSGSIYATDHLFRLSHPYDLMRRSGMTSEKTSPWSTHISDMMRQNTGRYPTEFENTVHNIAVLLEKVTTVTYITSAVGDISHMTYCITETKKNKRYGNVIVTGVKGTSREEEVRNAFTYAGADDLEMV